MPREWSAGRDPCNLPGESLVTPGMVPLLGGQFDETRPRRPYALVGNISNPEPESDMSEEPHKNNRQAAKGFVDLRLSHWVEIFLTLALVFVGIEQLRAYLRQAHIMAGQARIMEKQTEIANNQLTESQAQERPWISIIGARPITPLVFDESGGHLTI